MNEETRESLFGTHGISPEEVSRAIRGELADWPKNGADEMAMRTLRVGLDAVATRLGIEFGRRNPAFMLHHFLRDCGFEEL